MDVREALVQRMVQRISRMRSALERFDDAAAERERVNARWNVRDLAAHLAHWTNEAAARLPELAAGAEMPSYDLDRVNEAVYQRNRRMSFVMLLPQLRAAEERLLTALRTLDPAQLVGDTNVRRWIDEAAIEHYDRHWPALKAAVDRLG